LNKIQLSQQSGRQEGDLGHMARYYDLVMFFLTQGREKKLRKVTLDLAQIKPGDKVLEIGCGTGTLTIAAKSQVGVGGEVVGIDIAPEMISAAVRKAKRKGADVSFKVGSIANIPFPDNRFDTVLCSFMIFHMPEDIRRKGLAEIFRVLKSGGSLFVIDTVDLRELESALEENSFTGIKINQSKLNFIGLWYLRGLAKKS
jgi:ubiquinone/menaquinone biosynthesis C-methylase UbiE